MSRETRRRGGEKRRTAVSGLKRETITLFLYFWAGLVLVLVSFILTLVGHEMLRLASEIDFRPKTGREFKVIWANEEERKQGRSGPEDEYDSGVGLNSGGASPGEESTPISDWIWDFVCELDAISQEERISILILIFTYNSKSQKHHGYSTSGKLAVGDERPNATTCNHNHPCMRRKRSRAASSHNPSNAAWWPLG